jgi:hypothetical protein
MIAKKPVETVIEAVVGEILLDFRFTRFRSRIKDAEAADVVALGEKFEEVFAEELICIGFVMPTHIDANFAEVNLPVLRPAEALPTPVAYGEERLVMVDHLVTAAFGWLEVFAPAMTLIVDLRENGL